MLVCSDLSRSATPQIKEKSLVVIMCLIDNDSMIKV